MAGFDKIPSAVNQFLEKVTMRAHYLMGVGIVIAAKVLSQQPDMTKVCDVDFCDAGSRDFERCLKLRSQRLSSCLREQKRSYRNNEQNVYLNLKEMNGIEVMQPQLYDDALLKQMLASAQARLALLNVVDQTSIVSRLGTASGAASNTTSIAASIQGPALPQVSSVLKAGASAPDVTTTQTPPPSSVPNLPGPSIPLPTNISTSSSDVLNEQMQLSDQIANLSLLLEGPISGRLTRAPLGRSGKVTRPKVTIGIPVMILPRSTYRNAAAVVEVYIKSSLRSENGRNEPAVVTLLPREKTYNVAAISEKNLVATGSITTQVASLSGGFLKSRKSLYVVQDQDTLASTFTASPVSKEEQIEGRTEKISYERVGVWWIFRPVLGQSLVRPGSRMTFVQVALPPGSSPEESLGDVTVDTYWRRVNKKTGAIGEIIPGSLNRDYPPLPEIRNPLILQQAAKFSAASIEDLHNGQLSIAIEGSFLPGSYVRIGNQKMMDPATGLSLEDQKLMFSVPTATLATAATKLVSRDGTETQISLGDCAEKPDFKATSKLVDDSHADVEITFTRWPEVNSFAEAGRKIYSPDEVPLLLVIGGKVYGPHDQILRSNKTLSVIAPVSDLFSKPRLTVMPLFVTDKANGVSCTASQDLSDFFIPNRTNKFVLLGTSEPKGENGDVKKSGDQSKGNLCTSGYGAQERPTFVSFRIRDQMGFLSRFFRREGG